MDSRHYAGQHKQHYDAWLVKPGIFYVIGNSEEFPITQKGTIVPMMREKKDDEFHKKKGLTACSLI